MKQASSAFFALFLLIVLGSSCNDPTLIGSDLLDEDQVNVSSIDTITLRTHTIKGDTIRTYSPFINAQLGTYLAGNMEDPIFGLSKASIYGQLLLEQTTPDFSNAVPDSLVLVLPYDSLAIYGAQPQTYGFEVYRLIEDMDNTLSYYSNESFMTDMMPIGSIEKTINPASSISTYDPNIDSIIAYPHLRIKIEDFELINTLMTDTLLYENDSIFLDFFKGIHIRPTTTTPSMLAFKLFDNRTGMKLYYTQNDTLKEVFHYRFLDESVKMVNFEHQYDNSPVEEFIEEKSLGDSLIFVQSMAGLETIIEIPYVDNYEDIIVNNATLELFIADLPEDGAFDPITQLLFSTRGEDGSAVIIDDVLFSESNLSSLFGGVVVSGKNGSPDKYVFNISSYFQDVISGRVNNQLIISNFLKSQRASRSIFYGAGHSDYPAKLKVTFTKI